MFYLGRLCLCFLCLLCASGLKPAAADDFFDIVENNLIEKDTHPEQAACQRAVYSKSFDRWIKAYTEGRKADASAAWKGVLAETRGTAELYELGSQISTRLQFLEGKQGRANVKVEDTVAALKAALEETQKDLGYCKQTSSLAGYIAHRYTTAGDYKNALLYQKRALFIQQHAKRVDEARNFRQLISLSQLQIKMRDFVGAKQNAEQALEIATKAHAADGRAVARALLSQIKTASQVK